MKKVLVVVDMQNDFISGVLGTKEAIAIEGNVVKMAMDYKDKGIDIIFTKDTHEDNYLETAEGKKLPVSHCIKGTNGFELCDGLKKLENDSKVFEKPSFGSTELGMYIKECGYDEIEFVGVCTDICVLSNAVLVKAFVPESNVVVYGSLCAGVTVSSHENALNAMKCCHIEVK